MAEKSRKFAEHEQRDISTLSPVTFLPLAPAGQTPLRVMTIAGSDSGGGAGIQADLRTLALLGVHALVAVTAVTVQNSVGVKGFHEIPLDVIAGQIEARRACHSQLSPDMPVHYPLAVIADVAMDVCSSHRPGPRLCHPGHPTAPDHRHTG